MQLDWDRLAMRGHIEQLVVSERFLVSPDGDIRSKKIDNGAKGDIQKKKQRKSLQSKCLVMYFDHLKLELPNSDFSDLAQQLSFLRTHNISYTSD